MHIQYNSKKIKKGDIFIAIGKGHDYVNEAIDNGASKVIVEYGNYSVPTKKVKDTRKYLIKYLKKYYYDEIKDLNIIGITGTNGKTTTAYLIYQALNLLNSKCSYIGTIGFYMDSKIKDLDNTTPDLIDLYEMLLESKKNGCKNVVMEVSSHSISLKRISALKFDYVLFTNLTLEHLNYHKTMKKYFKAKKNLLKYLKKNGKKIVNVDDPYMKKLKRKAITIGCSGTYKIKDYYYNDGTTFYLNDKKYKTKLLGRHNIYNVSFTIALLESMGFCNLYNIIKKLIPPSGRLEKIANNIFIDYAHTPDAVEKIINSVKEFSTGKIITVIGCGGNRDKSKRPIMAKISTTLSNYVIFTSDNPRSEEPLKIIEDMTDNLDNTNYIVEVSREEAIKKGIQMLEKNDILLVLGKGHEKYQIINDIKYPFDDAEIIRNNIRR